MTTVVLTNKVYILNKVNYFEDLQVDNAADNIITSIPS